MSSQSLGKILRSLRESRFISQVDLSLTIGLSTRHYQKIEYGNIRCNIETLNKILKTYEMNLYNFFDLFLIEKFYEHGLNFITPFFEEGELYYITYDINGLITDTCINSTQLTGYSYSDLVGKMYVWDLCSSEQEKKFSQELLAIVLKTQPKPMPWTGLLNAKSGKMVKVQSYWRYNLDSNNELTSFSLISIPIK